MGGTGEQSILELLERVRTPAELRYRESIKNPTQIVACWDLDGILADEKGLSSQARPILAGFDRRRWTHVVTTASPAEHAYPLLRPVEDLLAGIFTETASGYGKDYTPVRDRFPGSDLLVIGDNAYDVPSDGGPAIFLYGTDLSSLARMAHTIAFIGAGNIDLGFDELRCAWVRPDIENSPLYLPAVFGEIKGTKTIIVE